MTCCEMQEIQKATCNSCGTTFVAENGATLCPSCSANQEHHHSGCGCGHWQLNHFFILSVWVSKQLDIAYN
jgi:hypothetical protein